MIKAVIFDIDNTMYDFDKANRTGMAALRKYAAENFGMEPDEAVELIKRCMDIVAERTGGNCAALHNRLLRFQCFLEQIGSTDYGKALEMYHVYWDALIEDMEPEPGLLSLLRSLRERGIKIGIGSDMTAYMQYKKLIKLGAMRYLDFIVTSEEAGAEKPTPRFFELCVEKAGCKPEECVFIGDSLKKDVIGPTKCGLIGTLYRPKEKAVGAGQSDGGSQEEVYPVVEAYEDNLWKEEREDR